MIILASSVNESSQKDDDSELLRKKTKGAVSGVSSLHADWLIVTCYSDLGETLTSVSVGQVMAAGPFAQSGVLWGCRSC